ncbi:MULTISPECIES: SDR family oxidoreductase [Halomonadaceae]|uniref:SDR family oxidoreductase n=1 Tax=Vreelandella janggokensis TaxID=370767 RepID=A0ABT4IV48_9GAMM|nr:MULTISPECIES: SDR family oxidoreductase [Halomonas]MCW4150847.1 SDR family oxidoreductase [Halomonas sp. 18H]MCZ0927554.1 SDR family oxidoreductase [Halomonas janggokensis]MCZ0930062.1 SDR family oxidoreductase [Halomonas janggokensis]MDR5885774.1 SDR family oxidoreductase [Halomonas janggokensis]QPL46136.1 SDR family oxidoreductase [Halomonas sp. A40-4]
MTLTVLIIGCGDIGITLGRELLSEGHRVIGVRRHVDALQDTGIEPLALDLNELEDADAKALPEADYVIYTVSADHFEESAYQSAYPEGLKRVLSVMEQHATPPRRVFFVSSTSVYGQQEGEVVNEESPTEPTSFSGTLMCEAEQALINHPLPGTVVRFSGIYGPGRDRLIHQVAEGRIAAVTPVIYSNRIHRDDCTGILAHLIHCQENSQPLADLYLGSDCEPVTMHNVMDWIAQQLKVTSTDTMQSPLRRRTSKRCDNRRILETGYQFRYPTFREGYAQVLKKGGFWRVQKA